MIITFEHAKAERDRAPLTAINIQYLEWIGDNIRRDFGLELTDLIGGPISEYVAATLAKLCEAAPPKSVFYLVRRDGRPAGMGGIRRLPDGVSEMKRVFVSPGLRSGGMGAIIVKRLISDADAFGYARIRLESGPFMTSAHRLYEARGFAIGAPTPVRKCRRSCTTTGASWNGCWSHRQASRRIPAAAPSISCFRAFPFRVRRQAAHRSFGSDR